MRGLLVCGAVLGALAMPAAAGAQQPWSDPSLGPDRRADLVLDAMTLKEKAELMSNDTGTAWAYFNAGIERLGIPSLRMLDAGAGLRLGGITLPDTGNPATAMPSPLLLAAAFDPALAARYGRTVADEVRQVGGNVLLGPERRHHPQPVVGPGQRDRRRGPAAHQPRRRTVRPGGQGARRDRGPQALQPLHAGDQPRRAL